MDKTSQKIIDAAMKLVRDNGYVSTTTKAIAKAAGMFQLGNLYKADYLIMGKSLEGYEFILVKLESPYGNITLKDGQLGAEFRDGISQLEY